MTPDKLSVPGTFAELGIAPKLLAVLDAAGYTTPTPIQHQAIPVALAGKDVVGIAQTGTGKTLAFGLPMIQRLATVKGQGLIMLPTRELALQVDDILQKVGRAIGLRTAVLIGGAPMPRQIQALRNGAHVIIATPGRLVDYLEQKILRLDQVTTVVLDEADRMFDIGFAPQIKRILKLISTNRQTMLFSATMPPAIAAMAAEFMKLPLRIEVAPAGTSAAKVEQEIFMVPKELKLQLLDKILLEYKGSILIFSRTKFGAKRIAAAIRHFGHQSSEIHSNRSLGQRKEALAGFKSGKYRVLVATDIAARGIDVTGIELVINFDLPDNSEDYVHRIGRTGRAGMSGKAISFASPDQRNDIRDIERLIRKVIPMKALPILPPARKLPPPPPRDFNSGGFNRSSRPGQFQGQSRSGGQRNSNPRSGGQSSRSGGQSRGGFRSRY